MTRLIILSALGWLLLEYAMYPAHPAPVRQSLDSYYRHRMVAAHKRVLKIRHTVAVRPVQPIRHRPMDTLTPADRIVETYDVLKWPKLPLN